MTFPAKVFCSFLAAFVLAAVILFSAAIAGVRQAYGRMEARQVETAFVNARRELERGAEDAGRRVGLVAESESTTRMVLDLSRPQPDYSTYANDASGAARTHSLELFEFVAGDGTVISSAGALPPIGSKEDWVAAAAQGQPNSPAFLRIVTGGGEPAIAQLAVRTLSVGDRKLYAVGGRTVDQRLLAALPLGPGMRARIFVNAPGKCEAAQGVDAAGAPATPGGAADFLAQVCRSPAAGGEAHGYDDAGARERDFALPLAAADGSTLGTLMLSYSSAAQMAEEQALWRRLWTVLALAILSGAAVSYWSAARLVRPLVRLARSAHEIARTGGQAPGARAEERGGPEVVALASALNHASQKLAAERDRLMQAERVAAWREMTRRVTAEIEAALDALAEARKTGDVSEGIAGFHRVLDRFRDFGELRVLPMETIRLNDVVRGVLRDLEPLFHPATADVTRPPVAPEVALAEDLPALRGDLPALTRAVDTFLLYAVYSMPAGGTFVVRTERAPGFAVMRLEWPGPFPNEEEAARLFSSAPVKRVYTAGLELASAQAVISDHGGTVETSRTPSVSAIIVRLPEGQEAPAAAPAPAESRSAGTTASAADHDAGRARSASASRRA
jgi:signal transduction histidine kinase